MQLRILSWQPNAGRPDGGLKFSPKGSIGTTYFGFDASDSSGVFSQPTIRVFLNANIVYARAGLPELLEGQTIELDDEEVKRAVEVVGPNNPRYVFSKFTVETTEAMQKMRLLRSVKEDRPLHFTVVDYNYTLEGKHDYASFDTKEGFKVLLKWNGIGSDDQPAYDLVKNDVTIEALVWHREGAATIVDVWQLATRTTLDKLS